MSEREPGESYSPEPNILESKAAEYLAQSNRFAPSGHDGRAPVETAEIVHTRRVAVALAATAGIVSGGIIGATEFWIRQEVFDGMENLPWREQLPYWLAFLAFAGVISAIEIVFLYAVALRGVGRVMSRAGLSPCEVGYAELFARGLARAALEFPNPRVSIFGIDPYAYVSRWKLAAKNVAYKLKVGVSSFLLRIFLRRVMARMAVRGIVPLAAGPLYAAWNAFIISRIIGEASIRALAPVAVDDLLAQIFVAGQAPSEEAAQLMLQGAGEMLKRHGDAHPNHVFLLARLRDALGMDTDIEIDWAGHRAALPALDRAEQERILDVLTLSAIIGSKVVGRQKALLREACEACGVVCRESRIGQLHRSLRKGRLVPPEGLAEVRNSTSPRWAATTEP